jgi:proline iminopeptidase
MARSETLRVSSSGAALSVRHYAGDGDPIVLLHGGPGMGDYFGAMPEMLSPPHHVVSYDQRGCGKSVCDGSFDIDSQIADLDAIRAHFGARRMHLFGHSWGGLLGQLYARAHRDRVASLALCCSMVSTGKNVAALESKCIAERVIAKPKRSAVAWALAGTLMQLPGKFGDLGFGFIMKQLLPNYLARPDVTQVPFDVTRGSKRAWRRTNQSIKTLADDHLSAMALDVPVLIVYGEQDVIRETSPMLAQRYPGATMVPIANAAHFPWVEQPQIFAKTLSDFYRR